MWALLKKRGAAQCFLATGCPLAKYLPEILKEKEKEDAISAAEDSMRWSKYTQKISNCCSYYLWSKAPFQPPKGGRGYYPRDQTEERKGGVAAFLQGVSFPVRRLFSCKELWCRLILEASVLQLGLCVLKMKMPRLGFLLILCGFIHQG